MGSRLTSHDGFGTPHGPPSAGGELPSPRESVGRVPFWDNGHGGCIKIRVK